MSFVRGLLGAVCATFIGAGWSGTPVVDGLLQRPLAGTHAVQPHGTGVNINASGAKLLSHGVPAAVLTSIPLADGSTDDFDVEAFSIFNPDSRIVARGAGGTEKLLPFPDIKMYRGTGRNDPDRNIYISVLNGTDVNMVINTRGGKGDTVAVTARDGARVETVLSAGRIPEDKQRPLCDTDAIPGGGPPAAYDEAPGAEPDYSLRYDIEYRYDLGYEYFLDMGSDEDEAIRYFVNLMGAVNAVYLRDLNTRLIAKNVVLWTDEDPVDDGPDGGDTFSQIASYRSFGVANLGPESRDCCHFIDTHSGIGGRAYLSAICRKDFGYAVSNIDANVNFPANPNRYYWDLFVIAHETGHNVGSSHTHCYIPSIDCCFVEAGCGECEEQEDKRGTIMSYCHQTPAGVDFRFHDRVIAVIRNYLRTEFCVDKVDPNGRIKLLTDTSVTLAQNSQFKQWGSIRRSSGDIFKTFFIRNSGIGTLQLTTGTPHLAGSPLFYLSAGVTTTTLGPGAETSFTVRLRPSSPGIKETNVVILSSDPGLSTFTVRLKATVQNLGPWVPKRLQGDYPIPDSNMTGITIPIDVADFPTPLADVDFLVGGTDCQSTNSATKGIAHGWIGDLDLSLTSPDGTVVKIIDRAGWTSNGSASDYICGAIFDDECDGPDFEDIDSSRSHVPVPYSGAWWPAQNLSAFRGKNANGQWLLKVRDVAGSYTGSLQDVTLMLTPEDNGVLSSADDWALLP